LASISTLPPQIYQSYKIKSAEHVSLFMLINFLIGAVSWITYALLTDSLCVLITNVFIFIFAVLMIGLKIKYSLK
ncbi:MAG: SemiSWEET family transporter, partial [bacterium]